MEYNLGTREALELLFSKWSIPQDTEEVSLKEALGRVLAEQYYAKYDIPVVRASAMDGIAVRGEDILRMKQARDIGGDAAAVPGKDVHEAFPDTESWKAGEDYVRADTGDDFDDRFDTVIAIEQVTILPSGGVRIEGLEQVEPGQCVRPAGSTVRRGVPLGVPGLPLRATDLAALAMGGIDRVLVKRKPRVVFQPTGSELTEPGEPLQRGGNFDSNGIMAYGLLTEMGAEPLCRRWIPDDPDSLRSALEEALKDGDIIILNGGSSKGEEDYNTRLLAERGELLVHWVKAGPGRPMGIAVIDGKPVINLSGPPLGALNGLEWCIRPLVCRFLGTPAPYGRKLQGYLTKDAHGPRDALFLCMMNVELRDGYYMVTPLPRGVTDQAVMIRGNAMYCLPEGVDYLPAGTLIEVDLLRDYAMIPVAGEPFSD